MVFYSYVTRKKKGETMQIQPISQNNQQNFGLKSVHKGDAAQLKGALEWVIGSLTEAEQMTLLAKMRRTRARVSIEITDFSGKVPQLFLRDSKGRPAILHISERDGRQNLPTLITFLDKLPKSKQTTTPQEGLSVIEQLKREFGILA